MKRILGLLLSMGLSVSGVHAQEKPEKTSLNKIELRTQDPAITDEILKNQLWSLFKSQDRRSDKKPTQQIRFISLDGKAYSSRVSNICQQDNLSISFAPIQKGVDDNKRDADTKVRAYGFKSSTWFYIIDKNSTAFAYKIIHDPDTKSCDIKAEDIRYIKAKDEIEAALGYRVTQAVRSAISSNSLQVTGCSSSRRTEQENLRECNQRTLALTRDIPSKIEKCDKQDFQNKCWKIEYNGNSFIEVLTIMSGPASLQKPIDNYKIKSVKREIAIVLTHSRPD